MRQHTEDLVCKPLTLARWPDFERLFGQRGACGGCWCMWWRLKRSEFDRQKGAGNKRAMKALVASGEVPGLLAYAGQEPIAWCAVAPREHYPSLDRSRILQRIDETPVWSVVCFFVKKSHRNRGISIRLLQAAIAYVRQQGGQIVEGYPVEPQTDTLPTVFAWTGLSSAFKQAGFSECARRSATRPLMRYHIE